MVVKICPHCNRTFITEDNVIDFIHECNSRSEVLDNEDVVVMGDWEDYIGTGVQPAQMVTLQGKGNTLWGTRAWLDGEYDSDVTSRGNNTQTFRTRQHLQFINLEENNDNGN